MNFSARASTLHITLFLIGNLFQTKYRYKSLKYGLVKYPAWISFTLTGKCVPFNTFLCIISKSLSISVCFGKKFYLTYLFEVNHLILVAL